MRLTDESRHLIKSLGAELAASGYRIERLIFNPQSGRWELRAGSFDRQISLAHPSLSHLRNSAIAEARRAAA